MRFVDSPSHPRFPFGFCLHFCSRFSRCISYTDFGAVKPNTISRMHGQSDRCDIDVDTRKIKDRALRQTNLQITRQTAIAKPLMDIWNISTDFEEVAFGSSFIQKRTIAKKTERLGERERRNVKAIEP